MHQPGITREICAAARFVSLAVQAPERAAGVLSQVPTLVDQVAAMQPGGLLRCTVALGSDLLARLGRPVPPELKPFVELSAGDRRMPATQADVLLHVNGERPDLCFELARRVRTLLGDAATALEDEPGFRYFDARDLTGFIDGTENPEVGEERAEAALIADGEFAGGSYVLAQRYHHNLTAFAALPQAEQERVIGRTKPDSIELADKPDSAHISRVVIEEDGEELEIVRHSMPIGGVDRAGLFFLAYCAHLTTFEKMLARMVGTVDGEGTHDRLLDFTTPQSGHFFFAPSLEQLKAL